jgi:hypothetical protein
MKAISTLFAFFISLSFSLTSHSQVITGVLPSPVPDIDAVTDYADCANPGTPIATFTVAGLSTLSSSFELANIDLSFNLACGANMLDLGLWIKSPAGTCMKIYNPIVNPISNVGLNGQGTYPGTYNLSLRDGSCLNLPNLDSYVWATSTNRGDDGFNGVFLASLTQTLSGVFSGQNPNGPWTIYAAETNAATNWAPCLTAASITFANATLTDQSGIGDNCENAIVWAGQPICASNSGKTGSTQAPGHDGALGFKREIGGVACSWNAANNNDTWIKFTATTAGNLCISISGLDGLSQSIVVRDANVDNNNNPCSQVAGTNTNDPNWVVMSCPDPVIYEANNNTGGGSYRNQQHCFIAAANQTYYLVVDGLSGATSSFYITGITGGLQAILPTSASQQSFVSNTRKESETPVSMTGGLLKTNAGNKKFNQQILIYDSFGNLIYTTRRTASGFSELNLYQFMRTGFNVIKIKDDQGGDYTFKLLK